VAVATIVDYLRWLVLPDTLSSGPGDAEVALSGFRDGFYRCLTRRADALFELTDALLCTDGPVKSLVGLSLAPEHRRGHGAMYDAVNAGRIDVQRLRTTVTGLALPRAVDGRLMLAVDTSAWLRPDAATSPSRLFCHVYGRGRGSDQFIPGWPYSFVAALEPGRTSWTQVLDAVRLGPDDDVAEVTAAQVRQVLQRLIGAGQWQAGDPQVLVVFDAGYDLARLAFLLADLLDGAGEFHREQQALLRQALKTVMPAGADHELQTRAMPLSGAPAEPSHRRRGNWR